MTKVTRTLVDKYNDLRGEYWLAVLGDDPIRTEYLENELSRIETMIASTKASNMLEREIKRIDRIAGSI